MKKFYAGVGSRETPRDILNIMTIISYSLRHEYTLRSGGAIGADTAFQSGAGFNRVIYKAHHATADAIELASTYHPNWKACKGIAKKLHGRNMQIVLGEGLAEPVEFVLCWTPGAKLVGGTAMAIRVAEDKDIPVFNLADSDQFDQFVKNYLNGNEL